MEKKQLRRNLLSEKFKGMYEIQWKKYQENIQIFEDIYGIDVKEMIHDKTYKKNVITEIERDKKFKIIRIADTMYNLDLL